MIERVPTPVKASKEAVRASGLLSFNIARLTGGRKTLLTERQRSLSKKHRLKKRLPPLEYGVSVVTVRKYAELVYDHLAMVLHDQWKVIAQDEPFPDDLSEPSEAETSAESDENLESRDLGEASSSANEGAPNEDVFAVYVRPLGPDFPAKVALRALLAFLLLTSLTASVDLRQTKADDPVVRQSENPVRNVLDVQVETGAATGSKGGIVFPEEDSVNGHHNLQRSTVKFPLEYYQDALKHGGYMVGGGRIKLKLSTRSDESIEVYKIRPIVESVPMPIGVAIRDVGHELTEDPLAQRAGFLLDAPDPAAQNIRDDGRLMGKMSTTWHLTPVSKQISPELVLTFYANTAAYRFSIEVEYILSPKEGTGGQRFSQIVNLDGEPFKVAADICMTQENRYKVPNMDDLGRLSRLRYNVVAVPDTRPGATSGSYTTTVSPDEFAKICERS